MGSESVTWSSEKEEDVSQDTYDQELVSFVILIFIVLAFLAIGAVVDIATEGFLSKFFDWGVQFLREQRRGIREFV